MLYGYIAWLYGEGFVWAWQRSSLALYKIADFFSFDILVKTWFAPWKNDVLSAKNIALGDRMKLWEMNMVSRLVGVVLRTVIIIVALVTLAISSLLVGLSLVLWFLLPIIIIVLPLLGLYLYFQG